MHVEKFLKFFSHSAAPSEPHHLKFFQKNVDVRAPSYTYLSSCYCSCTLFFPFLEQSCTAVCCSYTFRPQTVEYQKRIQEGSGHLIRMGLVICNQDWTLLTFPYRAFILLFCTCCCCCCKTSWKRFVADIMLREFVRSEAEF